MPIDLKGTRVRPSAKFASQFPKSKVLRGEGTVVGISRDKRCVRVRWDNYSDVQVLHPAFVELAASEFAPKGDN